MTLCGENETTARLRIANMGCGSPLTIDNVFRCADCEVPFCIGCIRKHFGGKQKMEGHLPYVLPLEQHVIDGLAPGIRRTVLFLRSHRFDTRDSGDGVHHVMEPEGTPPYVHIDVEPDSMVSEAKRLVAVLKEIGVHVFPLGPDGIEPSIEAHFTPCDGGAILSLYNVNDASFPTAG